MAAMLDRNGPDGKPMAYPRFAKNELVPCQVQGCRVSYTLAYGQVENRMEGNQNILDAIRRTASALVKADHPHVPIVGATYVWGGLKLEWLDRDQANAAGM
jgi:hypothetical protein